RVHQRDRTQALWRAVENIRDQKPDNADRCDKRCGGTRFGVESRQTANARYREEQYAAMAKDEVQLAAFIDAVHALAHLRRERRQRWRRVNEHQRQPSEGDRHGLRRAFRQYADSKQTRTIRRATLIDDAPTLRLEQRSGVADALHPARGAGEVRWIV